jgi:hypothetical protein
MKIFPSLILAVFATAASAGTETGTVLFGHGTYGASATSAGFTFVFLEGGTKTGNPACFHERGRRTLGNQQQLAGRQVSDRHIANGFHPESA